MKTKHIFIALFAVTVIIPQILQAQVAGNTEIFRQEGIASWYGREFDGRLTASGEVYDSSQLTAAHPTLPFGTVVTVTNRHNNRSVTVRINDRGPFVAARIIDVSRAAAEHLDMIITGTAPVLVESVERIAFSSPYPQTVLISPSPQASAPVQPAPVQQFTQPAQPIQQTQPAQTFAPTISASTVTHSTPLPVADSTPVFTQPQVVQRQFRLIPSDVVINTNNSYRLQVGSFRVARNAVESFERLKNAGLEPAYERHTENDTEYFRVVVAGVRGSDVTSVVERIAAAGFLSAMIRLEH